MDCQLNNNKILPPEIWEKILKNIDNPNDLLRIKSVCRDWNVIIEKILRKNIEWKKRCHNVILPECIFPTLIQVSPRSIHDYKLAVYETPSNLDNKIWREVYRSWKKWQWCLSRQETIDTVADLPTGSLYERITTAAVAREIIGIATSEGFIYFCRINDLKQVIYKADHKDYVTHLKLWHTQEGYLIAVARNFYSRIKFWNIMNKIELASPFMFADTININKSFCYLLYNDIITIIRCHDKGIEILINTAVISPLELSKREEIVATFSNSESLIELVTTDRFNRIDHINVIPEVKFFDTSFSRGHGQYIQIPQKFMSSSYKKFQIFDTHMMIALSDELIMFCFDRAQWHVYNLFCKLYGVVKSVYYHCKILILGLDSGTIHIYHIKNKSDLANFDFSSSNSKKIIVDNEAIVSISLTDVQGEQFIIAATDRNVHVIRFFDKF